MRHIRRLHKGEGIPVKNKSFDTEKLACSTAHSGLDPRNNISREEKDKKGQGVKNTGELDPVDSIYPTFKKLKD